MAIPVLSARKWPPFSVSASLPMFRKYVQIDAAAKKIVVERAIEGGNEVIEAKLPAVVSVIKGINEPRLPNLMGIRKAGKVEIPKWTAGDLGEMLAKSEPLVLPRRSSRLLYLLHVEQVRFSRVKWMILSMHLLIN